MALVKACDLCEMDGERAFAVACYWDEAGKEWDVCEKHLAVAKEAGLEYEKYEE